MIVCRSSKEKWPRPTRSRHALPGAAGLLPAPAGGGALRPLSPTAGEWLERERLCVFVPAVLRARLDGRPSGGPPRCPMLNPRGAPSVLPHALSSVGKAMHRRQLRRALTRALTAPRGSEPRPLHQSPRAEEGDGDRRPLFAWPAPSLHGTVPLPRRLRQLRAPLAARGPAGGRERRQLRRPGQLCSTQRSETRRRASRPSCAGAGPGPATSSGSWASTSPCRCSSSRYGPRAAV